MLMVMLVAVNLPIAQIMQELILLLLGIVSNIYLKRKFWPFVPGNGWDMVRHSVGFVPSSWQEIGHIRWLYGMGCLQEVVAHLLWSLELQMSNPLVGRSHQ